MQSKNLCRFFLLIFIPLFAKAQETTSEITGLITSGQTPLAGATVTILNVPTGTIYKTSTRNNGRYNVPGLRVGGPYTVTADYVGYKEEKQENINLVLGEEFNANFTLTSQSQSLQDVTVTTTNQNRIFNNAHTGSQEIVTRAQIEQLPTINRSISDFTRLEPTANSTSFGTSFGGRSAQLNNITVDGANFNNGFGLSSTLGGQAGAQPISLEAIDQIQVNVSPYDVRQGGFTGAGINTVTKSGTNQFKGSVYTYIKGPGLQGYKVGDVTVPRTDFNFHTYGASLGGPIIKNKLFFFANYEEVKQTAPAFGVVASTGTNTPNPGIISQASEATLDSLTAFLKSKFNYDPGAYQNYSLTSQSKKLTARIDWNIDSKSTLTLKYNRLRSYAEVNQSTSRAGFGFIKGPASQNYTYGLPFESSKYIINNNFDIFLAELNTRFSKNFSNKFQVGYTRERDPRAPGIPGQTMPLVDILNGDGDTYGSNILASFGYETYTYNNLINTDVYQLSDIATLYKGAHEITIGTQDYSRKYADAFVPDFAGGYQFPSLQAFYNAANGIGNPQDLYYQQWSNIPGGAFPFYYAGSTELGLFAQDKWRPSRNFTLTYGLRFDMTIYKSLFLDNPFFDALQFKDGKSYNIGKAPGNAVILSPRIGFNWDVFGNRSLQVRGGFGIFSGPPPFVWLANQGGNNGVLIAGANFTNVPFTTDAVKNPPVGVNTGAPKEVVSAASYGAAVTDKNFKYPTIIKTSLAADKRVGDGWIFTLEGSYSKDINAVYFSNLNLNEENAFALAGSDNRLRYLTLTDKNSNKYYHGTSDTIPNLSSAILMKNISKGYAYTATFQVQKTFRHLYVKAAYTYSQAKNVATGGSTASSLWSGRPVGNADPNGANLAYADYYQPHRVVVGASYRFEYAHHFATSVGAFFSAAPSGVGSYTYGGDLNGDGNNGNDLIYIPRSESEINLIDAGSYNKTAHTGVTTGTTADPRTADQIWQQLNAFISQDKYMSKHRGDYVKANAIIFPWYKDLDMNVTQDIYINTKAKKETDRHTIRVSLDLINAGNLLNKKWGLLQQQATGTPITFEGLAADGKTPLFSFPFAVAATQMPLTSSFANSTSILSRWQMQIGIKYLFN